MKLVHMTKGRYFKNMDRISTGALAENIAARYLQSKGYIIIAKNYRKPWGEIDIIAQRLNTTVFIEVKANTTDHKGFEPELRANGLKMHKVARTAQLYLQDRYPNQEKEWQLDIVSVVLNLPMKTASIKHFKNV
jgi:putative endonuclease